MQPSHHARFRCWSKFTPILKSNQKQWSDCRRCSLGVSDGAIAPAQKCPSLGFLAKVHEQHHLTFFWWAVAYQTLKNLDQASRMQDLSHISFSGKCAWLRIKSAHAPLNALCWVLWSGPDSDMSVAFSTFGDALAGILVGELHRHAMSEAKKGIILRAHLRLCRTQLLIFVTILLQPRQNASWALAAAGQRSMNHVDRSDELQVFNLIALLLRSAVLTWDHRYHSKLAICLRTKMTLYSTVAILFLHPSWCACACFVFAVRNHDAAAWLCRYPQ